MFRGTDVISWSWEGLLVENGWDCLPPLFFSVASLLDQSGPIRSTKEGDGCEIQGPDEVSL
eukprot:9154736-Alexandrium_andersonii.AAC.1